MDEAVHRCDGLTTEDIAFLQRIERDLPILADVSRADVLVYGAEGTDPVVIAQAQPHSVPPIYSQSLLGQMASMRSRPLVARTMTRGRFLWSSSPLFDGGAPVVQQVHPLYNRHSKIIGALGIEKTLIEHERHNRRSRAFRKAVWQFQQMVMHGRLRGTEGLSPFEEQDGILIIDPQRRIQYASGVANNLYRRLGYQEILPGKHLSSLETGDESIVAESMARRSCLEAERQEGDRIWIKRAIPLLKPPSRLARWWGRLSNRSGGWQVAGAILTIHDATEARREEQRLRHQLAMMQEVHHRVKNNLQTVVSLLRLRARRVASEEARQALEDSINRILSIAIVHEFLSQPEARVISITDVCQRIIKLTESGLMDPDQRIRLTVEGPRIDLPAQEATACALVVNELVQNALEHGYYDRRNGGTISIRLQDEINRVRIVIHDDGGGLPPDFDLALEGGLGLQIVRTLVENDLKGEFELREEQGVSAIVTFPKPVPGGGDFWSALE